MEFFITPYTEFGPRIGKNEGIGAGFLILFAFRSLNPLRSKQVEKKLAIV